MKGAAATAGMLSAAILFALAVPEPGAAQAGVPIAVAVVDSPRQAAAAEFVNRYCSDAMRQGYARWIRDNFVALGIARTQAEAEVTPARLALARFVFSRGRDGLLRDINLWYDGSKRHLIAYLANRYDADYLLRMAAILGSSAGARLLAMTADHGLPPADPAAWPAHAQALLDEFLRTVTDSERREIAGLQRAGETPLGQLIREVAAVQGEWVGNYAERYQPSQAEIDTEIMRLVASGEVRL